MCNKCLHVELIIKHYFQVVGFKTRSINKSVVPNFTTKCIKINKNYLCNYIHYNLDQLPHFKKQEIFAYIYNNT